MLFYNNSLTCTRLSDGLNDSSDTNVANLGITLTGSRTQFQWLSTQHFSRYTKRSTPFDRVTTTLRSFQYPLYHLWQTQSTWNKHTHNIADTCHQKSMLRIALLSIFDMTHDANSTSTPHWFNVILLKWLGNNVDSTIVCPVWRFQDCFLSWIYFLHPLCYTTV